MAASTANRGQVRLRVPRVLTPWLLPDGYKSSDDMSQDELVQEAREARPLLRELGWRDSAVLHPDIMNTRYLRTCNYVGRLPIRPYVIQILTTLGFSAFLGFLFFFGPQQDEASDLALGKGIYVIVGAFTGLIFGAGAGYSARTMSQFWVAYSFARVAQKVTENGVKRTVAVYELPLLRMAFADRHGERMFSGVEERSGFVNGRMNLETTLELAEITDPRQFYEKGAVYPCVSNFTGVTASRRHALNDMAKMAGRISAEKQARRENDDFSGWVGEHKGLTFFAIAAIVSVLMLIIGVEIDFGEIQNIGETFS